MRLIHKRSAAGNCSLPLAGHDRKLGKHLTHDLTTDIGETEVASHVPIREACMIESETVQHSGLEIVDMNRILDHVHAEVIGAPNGHTGLDSTSGGPHRKAT